MLTSKGKLSAQATTKLGLATMVAAFSIAAVTFADAAMASAQSTSAASAPASSTLEAQVQLLRECEEGSNYSREESLECLLEGMLSGAVVARSHFEHFTKAEIEVAHRPSTAQVDRLLSAFNREQPVPPAPAPHPALAPVPHARDAAGGTGLLSEEEVQMKLARCLLYAVTILGVSVISHAFSRHVLARDFAQYANVPQEIRDWYANAELTDAAKQRLPWARCCDHADVVKTQFRVNKSNGEDEWYWLQDGQWKRIPPDIIHWGVSAPGGEPVLFVYSNIETCFFPGQGGI